MRKLKVKTDKLKAKHIINILKILFIVTMFMRVTKYDKSCVWC